MIRIKNLVKNFDKLKVLKGISCDIHDGEIVIIAGSSGSGKSTLLRCINRLEEATSGEIWFNKIEITNPKTNIKKVRQDIGMVFQQFNLFPNLTVLENIILAPMKNLKITKRQAVLRANKLLEEVGLKDKADEFPKRLSGGQKQRVAIARALAMEPQVILFDEPTSALDPENIAGVLDVIRDLAKKGMTIIIVTHEMNFAREIGTRMLFLDDGKIIADGTPEHVMFKSKRKRVREFFDDSTGDKN